MNVFITDQSGKRYWGANGWTLRAEEAFDFGSGGEAFEFSLERGFSSGTVLLTDGKPEYDIRIPLGAPSARHSALNA
jgi:hypothetical protein